VAVVGKLVQKWQRESYIQKEKQYTNRYKSNIISQNTKYKKEKQTQKEYYTT
jgi:hypothetical protein